MATLYSALQLNADCLDDLPLEYDFAMAGRGGIGNVGVLALEAVVSGASSDGTLSEGGSSVVLDPGVRRMGLPQDYQDPDTLRDSPVTATTDTHTGESDARWRLRDTTPRCSYYKYPFIVTWNNLTRLLQVSCSQWRAAPQPRPWSSP